MELQEDVSTTGRSLIFTVFWKVTWRFQMTLNMYKPVNPLLSKCPRETLKQPGAVIKNVYSGIAH